MNTNKKPVSLPRLKPCPFCLGKASYFAGLTPKVECHQCCAAMAQTKRDRTQHALMLRWNRRPLALTAVTARNRGAATTTALNRDLDSARLRERSLIDEVEAVRLQMHALWRTTPIVVDPHK